MGRYKKLSAEEERLAIAYKAEGHTHKEVAEKFGISEAKSINIAKDATT